VIQEKIGMLYVDGTFEEGVDPCNAEAAALLSLDRAEYAERVSIIAQWVDL
jgi:hypothetical protein